MSVFGSRHLTEWADPTFDAVADLLDYETTDPAVVALSYQPLFPEVGETAEWPDRQFNVYRNRESDRVGVSVAE